MQFLLLLMKRVADYNNIITSILLSIILIILYILLQCAKKKQKKVPFFIGYPFVFFCVIVGVVVICELIYMQVLPEGISLVSFLESSWITGEFSDWAAMIGLVLTIITAIISTIIAFVAHRISKSQQLHDDFSFCGQFNLKFNKNPVDIQMIVAKDKSTEYLHYSNKLESNYKRSKQNFLNKNRINPNDIFVLKFKLESAENSQVTYILKRCAIFDSIVDWNRIETLLITDKNNVYEDVVSDFYYDEGFNLEAIIRNTNESNEVVEQHLITLNDPQAYAFKSKSEYSIYFEFILDSRDYSHSVNQMIMRIGIEICKINGAFTIKNSRQF